MIAPGTAVREGVDAIVQGRTGALICIGDNEELSFLYSGGLKLDVDYTPALLFQLAKMDGAIIIGGDVDRIARANVHLVPDPTVPTSETGTRHRTAERVAQSLHVPVVSISEEMGVINVYAGGRKHQLHDIGRLLERANQALQTLERYKVRLDDSLASLTALEVEDAVTVRDVASVVQRGEMVRRITAEMETMIVELGVDARLLRLQLAEVMSGLDPELDLVVADYPTIIDSYAGTGHDGDAAATPIGLRLLARVPRLDDEVAHRIAVHFGELAKLQRASIDDIAAIDGVDLELAEAVKDTLDRIAESSILDRFS